VATHLRIHRGQRFAGTALTAGLLAAALYGTGPAVAEPAEMPANAPEALQQMIDMSRESERLNQQVLGAQENLQHELDAQHAVEAKLAARSAHVAAAHAEVETYRPVIDRTATAAYQGARTNELFSVLASDSPQQMLDQISTLDVVSTATSDQLKKYRAATDAATDAESVARTAADNARGAAQQADTAVSDLERKQADLHSSISDVTTAWGSLSTRDKSSLAGSPFPPGFDRDQLLSDLVPGSGTSALAASLTRVGDPYVWGASGPDQFDCSGLVQWAFGQVGTEVPRTSSAQASYGTPVDKADLQPGDVVFFYPDITHVGIYAGDGLMVHASTFGVPVGVSPVDSTPYHSARRY